MCLSAVVTAVLLTYAFSEKYQAIDDRFAAAPEDGGPRSKERGTSGVSRRVLYAGRDSGQNLHGDHQEPHRRRTGGEALRHAGFQGGRGFRIFRILEKSQKILQGVPSPKHGCCSNTAGSSREAPFDSAVGKIQGGLSVKPTRETFLFELRAESSSPTFAAAVANSAAEAFIGYMGEISAGSNNRSQKRNEQDIRLSEQRLAAAKKAVASFKQRQAIADLPKEKLLGPRKPVRAGTRQAGAGGAHGRFGCQEGGTGTSVAITGRFRQIGDQDRCQSFAA